jgi:hypothetical protein
MPPEGDLSPSAEAPTSTPEAPPGNAAPPAPPGVLDELSGVLDSARESVSSFLELISLEAQRAGLALFWMVAWGCVAAVCIVAAWLGLMVVLAMGAISLGMLPIAAVFIITILNLAAGAVLIRVCIGMSRDLAFPATRRQLARNPPAKASA